MLWSGRITLVVMTSAMVLTHGSSEEPARKMRSTFFSPLLAHRHAEGNYPRHYKTTNAKGNDHRLKHKAKWDLEPIVVKLNNVCNKYESLWGEVKALYAPIDPCVPHKFGKNLHHMPRNLLPKGFKCAKLKTYKDMKNKVREVGKILSRFHSGVEYFLVKFRSLSSALRKSTERRLQILTELEIELKMLNMEIETALTRKRLKTKKRRLITPPTPPGTSRTALLINEWPILQNSKKFLHVWKDKLTNVFTCWEEVTANRRS